MTTLPQTAPLRLPRAMVPAQAGLPSSMLPGAFAPPGSAQGMSANDVVRILRANFWLIVITVMASGLIGYLVNSWLARNHSKYTANALVTVRVPIELPRPGIQDVI